MGDANESLDDARKELKLATMPDDFDFSNLLKEGSLIRVVLEYDALPIEVLSIGNSSDIPLAFRYRLIHVKSGQLSVNQSDNYYSLSGSSPEVRLILMPIDMKLNSVESNRHLEQVKSSLSFIYKSIPDNNYIGASSDQVKKLLHDPYTACFYYLGHGSQHGNGGFCLGADGKEILTTEALEAWLRDRPNYSGGFAFLNCCWSAITPTLGSLGSFDLARTLINYGYSTVIGTVLPPLDTIARPFAEKIFGSLVANNCNIHECFYDAIKTAWNDYKSKPISDSEVYSWAIYRLYGIIGEGYLWTSSTRPNGDVIPVINNNYTVFYNINELLNDFETKDKKEVFKILQNKSSALILKLLACGNYSPAVKKFSSFIIANEFMRNGYINFGEEFKYITDPLNGLLAQAIFGKEYESEIYINIDDIKESSSKRKNIDFQEGVESFLLNFSTQKKLNMAQSAALQLFEIAQQLFKEHETVDILEMQLSAQSITLKSLLEKIGYDMEIAILIQAAREFSETEQKVKLSDLHNAAYALALSEAMILQRTDDNEILLTKCDYRIETFEEDVLGLLFKLFEIGTYDRTIDRPVWWHVLNEVANSQIDNSKILHFVDRQKAINDAIRIMPNTLGRGHGIPVGRRNLDLPEDLAELWKKSIHKSGNEFFKSNNRRAVLLLPWKPTKDSPLDHPDCLDPLDAITLSIMEIFKQHKERRYWVHVDSESLIAPLETGWLWRWAAGNSGEEIIHEADNRIMLVVRGGEDDINGSRDAWKKKALHLIKRLSHKRVAFMLALSKNEVKESMNDFFAELNIAPVEFNMPTLDDIIKLIRTWEIRRGRVPDAKAFLMLKDRLNGYPTDENFSNAMRIWGRALQISHGKSPNESDVAQADSKIKAGRR